MLIVLSVSRLSKQIEGIQVAGHSQVKPDRFKVNSIFAVFIAKTLTYFLFSIFVLVANYVDNANDGDYDLLFCEISDILYVLVCLADASAICVACFFAIR